LLQRRICATRGGWWSFIMGGSRVTRNGRAWLVAAAAGLVAGCGAQGATEPPPPPSVTVAAPAVRDVEVWEELVGRFEAVESVEIRPQISGRLLKAHFVDGQMVRRGDVLFTIDPAPAQAAADRASAQAEEARAASELAASLLARAESLRESGAISLEEYDRRKRSADQAAAAARAAGAAARAAKVDLDFTVVRSPIDGRVSDRRVDPGNVVTADQSVLTTVVSQSPIHFEFSADPQLAGRLPRPTPGRRDGVQVFVRTESDADFAHAGQLDFLDNQVDARSGVVRGRAVFDNRDGRFTPGEFGRIRVSRGRIKQAMLVPESAINSDQTRKYVLVVGDKNMVEPRPVQLGPASGVERVVSGLDPGARVIVNGAGRVFPGMPVTPEPVQAADVQTPGQGG
jgi:RND family efflux transporter MFP subunit